MPPEPGARLAPFRLDGKIGVAVIFLVIWFVLQIRLAVTLNINWDEFFFLSHVHSYQQGRLNGAFQTFHVQLFGWLTVLPLSEAGQIVAGRLTMLLAEAGLCVCIFTVGKVLFGPRHAAFLVMAYLASGFVMGHGASFRADPLAAFLMMAGVALLFSTKRGLLRPASAGVLAAIGLLVTIKSVFYLPAFIAALVHQLSTGERRGAVAARFASAAACLAAIYVLGWLAHSSLLGTAVAAAPPQSQAAGALDKTVLSQALFPRWDFIVRWLQVGLVPAALLAAGLVLAIAELGRPSPARALTILLLAAPVLSLAVYRNAFPYFFPFIMAPAFLAAGLVFERLERPAWRYALFFLLLIAGLAQYLLLAGRRQSTQRAVIAAVHTIFPQPVSYIDGSGMIPSFPKAGPFLSTWGLEGAAAGGAPVLVPVMALRNPPLLVVNSPALAKALDPSLAYAGPRLPGPDEEALRNAYIPHWGPLRVAGRSLVATGSERRFSLAIAGRYTVECIGLAVTLDAAALSCGRVVELNSGQHRLTGEAGQKVTLRWGDHLPRPAAPVPRGQVYYGF